MNLNLKTIFLRPHRLNAIDLHLPFQLQSAVQRANWDDEVHAILLYGAGNAFCAGYDLKTFAEEQPHEEDDKDEVMPRYTNQRQPWDPSLDFQLNKSQF